MIFMESLALSSSSTTPDCPIFTVSLHNCLCQPIWQWWIYIPIGLWNFKKQKPQIHGSHEYWPGPCTVSISSQPPLCYTPWASVPSASNHFYLVDMSLGGSAAQNPRILFGQRSKSWNQTITIVNNQHQSTAMDNATITTEEHMGLTGHGHRASFGVDHFKPEVPGLKWSHLPVKISG